MGIFGLNVLTTSVIVIVAMVGLVVLMSFLEQRTPNASPRSTRVGVPRPIAGSMSELPEVSVDDWRKDTDLVVPLAESTHPLFGDPPEHQPKIAQQDVVHADAGSDPVTESVPVVTMARLLQDPKLDQLAASVISEIHHSRDLTKRSSKPPTTVVVAKLDKPVRYREEVLNLGGIGADRDLLGVLFAGYVDAGFPERRRVTGWVSAIETPPSMPGIDRDSDLRGRPGRVAELMRCKDDAKNWVTVNPHVDISLGIQRKEPTCELLKGLLWWRTATRDDPAVVPAEHCGDLAAALDEVVGHLDGNVLSCQAELLAALTRRAYVEGVCIRIEAIPTSMLERLSISESVGELVAS